jgi:hypothetical protein
MEEANPGEDIAGSEDALDFEIGVVASDATKQDLDQMTRNLIFELKDTNVGSAESVSLGGVSEGGKGDRRTIGTLAMIVMPGGLPGVIDLSKSLAVCEEGRIVKFKGKGFGFERSPEDLEKLLATLGMG